MLLDLTRWSWQTRAGLMNLGGNAGDDGDQAARSAALTGVARGGRPFDPADRSKAIEHRLEQPLCDWRVPDEQFARCGILGCRLGGGHWIEAGAGQYPQPVDAAEQARAMRLMDDLHGTVGVAQ